MDTLKILASEQKAAACVVTKSIQSESYLRAVSIILENPAHPRKVQPFTIY